MKLLKRIKVKPGVAIFLLYASIGIWEYARTKHWKGILAFGVLGIFFLLLDSGGKKKATV